MKSNAYAALVDRTQLKNATFAMNPLGLNADGTPIRKVGKSPALGAPYGKEQTRNATKRTPTKPKT